MKSTEGAYDFADDDLIGGALKLAEIIGLCYQGSLFLTLI